MQYKMILIRLLEHHPGLYDRLRRQRRMPPTLEYYARELKTLHDAWIEILSQAAPNGTPDQVASQALEMAQLDLVERSRYSQPPERLAQREQPCGVNGIRFPS